MPPPTTPDTTSVRLREPMTALGVRLARARYSAGLTLAQAAERSGVSPAHVSQIESGTANPTLRTLLQVAAAVGVEPGGLFTSMGSTGTAGADASNGAEPVPFAASHARGARGASRPVAVWDRTASGSRLLSARVLHGTVGDHATPCTHSGEEFIVVLQGRCRLHVGTATWDLDVGDSCHFDAGEVHHLGDASDDLLLSVVLGGER